MSGRIRDHEDIDARSIICRTGETLVVEGYDHLPLYVSIDNAAEAADVLNALVVRSRAAEVPA